MGNDLLSMSAAGSAVVLLWLLLYPVTRDRFSARWQYRVLKAALFCFLFPGRACLRLWAAVRSAVSIPPAVSPAPPLPLAPLAPETFPPVTPLPTGGLPPLLALRFLTILWAVGAGALLAYKLVS